MTTSRPDAASLYAAWHEVYEVEIGPHVFPTRKYRLAVERLVEEEMLSRERLLRPEPADEETLALVHTRSYLRKIRKGDFSLAERWRLEVPFSPELRRAFLICCGGAVDVARLGLREGAALHVGGGFHHAFPDHGEGFCLLNDVAVAARKLLEEGEIRRAAVVDLDVHHGNGTAAIFADDERVFTFSMHQEDIYPAVKPPSDLDIGLPRGTGDREYLDRLAGALPRVLESGPDLMFYLAGADPYREDQLGGLELSMEGLRERDELVLREARGAGVPVAVSLAGGYALRLDDTVEIHCATARTTAAALEAGAGEA